LEECVLGLFSKFLCGATMSGKQEKRGSRENKERGFVKKGQVLGGSVAYGDDVKLAGLDGEQGGWGLSKRVRGTDRGGCILGEFASEGRV